MTLASILTYLVGILVAVGLASAALYLYIVFTTEKYIFTSPEKLPVTEVALVLGASVSAEGVLSPILQERADQAAALYKAGKVAKILVTGDNATLSHDEVDPVGKYLVAAGIPKGDIFLDHAGFDTYSSMYRARDVFGVTNLTIVSQPFHLPRAVFIARSLGLTAYASPAAHDGSDLYNYVREIPASTKAAYDILFSRVPEYLGTVHPITGDGEDTWGGFSSTTVWQ